MWFPFSFSPAVSAYSYTNRVLLSLIFSVCVIIIKPHFSETFQVSLPEIHAWRVPLRFWSVDALIKTSQFICIINVTEMKGGRKGKTALNVQRNTKSLLFFIFHFPSRWLKMYLLIPKHRVFFMKRERVVWSEAVKMHCVTICASHAHLELSPPGAFRPPSRCQIDLCLPFLFSFFFCSVFCCPQLLETSLLHWANRSGSEWGD